MRKAIVIGCHVNGLGVIRSLSWKNFHIIALFYDEKIHFSHVSNLVNERVKAPHPRTQEKEFIDFLIQNSPRWKGALIIDTNDDVLIALSKNRKLLEQYYIIPTPEWGIARKFIEKPETYAVAAECNVPYPITFFPKTEEELSSIKDKIPYPCILKPVLGHLFFSKFGVKNFMVHNYDELRNKLRFCSESGYEVMLQEIIPGPESNIYQCMMYFNSVGGISATFLSRKLRQNPPVFGVARVAVSESVIPEIKDFTCRMAKRVGFQGILHSEFKQDPRDSIFKLMEVNGRISRSNWLATYSGINFPWIAFLDLNEHKQVEANGYKKSVYWIELAKDVSISLFHHRGENLTFKEYWRPYLNGTKTFADISRRDLAPFIKRISVLLKNAFFGVTFSFLLVSWDTTLTIFSY